MKPVMLMILDGWGIRRDTTANAVALAKTPNFDRYWSAYPHTELTASGEDVGLPDGVMGNSEVGHLNLGSGRIIYQDLTGISKSIRDGDFFTNRELVTTLESAAKGNGRLHLMGLLSDGGVHSHIDHVLAIIQASQTHRVGEVWLHLFLDGRDTPPQSGLGYVQQLESAIARMAGVKIASISGRYYAMDRDKRWDRVEKAYHAMVNATPKVAQTADAAIQASYDAGVNDEFMVPVALTDAGKIRDGDTVLFFNFRSDRAREITLALTSPDFSGFSRPLLKLNRYVTMTQYDPTYTFPLLFAPQVHRHIFGEEVAAHGKKQLRIAETEKYAHVTFFFNGGVETPYPGEDRCLIPSPKDVATYDLKPEMSANEVCAEVLKRIATDTYDTIILNFANPDMVGHTGVLSAGIKAVETVDRCMGAVVEAVVNKGGAVVMIADHGNCEMMAMPDGSPHTAHTTNPVPCLLVSPLNKTITLRSGGRLADVAPTLLDLMQIDKPQDMTGVSLIQRS